MLSQESTITPVKINRNGQVVTGFTSFREKELCSPEIAGVQVCISGRVENGQLFIRLTAKTPLGDFSHEVEVNGNQSFTWEPIPMVSVTIEVSELKETPEGFSFLVTLEVCVDPPFISKICKTFSKRLEVPVGNLLAGGTPPTREEIGHVLYHSAMLAQKRADGDCDC